MPYAKAYTAPSSPNGTRSGSSEKPDQTNLQDSYQLSSLDKLRSLATVTASVTALGTAGYYLAQSSTWGAAAVGAVAVGIAGAALGANAADTVSALKNSPKFESKLSDVNIGVGVGAVLGTALGASIGYDLSAMGSAVVGAATGLVLGSTAALIQEERAEARFLAPKR